MRSSVPGGLPIVGWWPLERGFKSANQKGCTKSRTCRCPVVSWNACLESKSFGAGSSIKRCLFADLRTPPQKKRQLDCHRADWKWIKVAIVGILSMAQCAHLCFFHFFLFSRPIHHMQLNVCQIYWNFLFNLLARCPSCVPVVCISKQLSCFSSNHFSTKKIIQAPNTTIPSPKTTFIYYYFFLNLRHQKNKLYNRRFLSVFLK